MGWAPGLACRLGRPTHLVGARPSVRDWLEKLGGGTRDLVFNWGHFRWLLSVIRGSISTPISVPFTPSIMA